MQRAAGRDDVVHDADALAVELRSVHLVDDDYLFLRGRYRLRLLYNRVLHVGLDRLARDDVVDAHARRYRVRQRDALRLGAYEHVYLSEAADFFKKRVRRLLYQLRVAEHDERRNREVRRDAYLFELARDAAEVKRIEFSHC